jgi:hypothetical protein
MEDAVAMQYDPFARGLFPVGVRTMHKPAKASPGVPLFVDFQ